MDLNDLANQQLPSDLPESQMFNSTGVGILQKQSQQTSQLIKSGSNQGRRKKSQGKPSLGNKSLRLTNLQATQLNNVPTPSQLANLTN